MLKALILAALSGLTLNALAATPKCSLNEMLKSAKPNKKCADAFLAKIPNEEDRREAKYRLQQWKPVKDLEVQAQGGIIEAFQGPKLLFRSILLQNQKPMLIWMDGKILTDNSDNPSFARRLDNAMKIRSSSALSFFIPEAAAQAPPGLQQTLQLLFTLDQPAVGQTSDELVGQSKKFGEFLPASNALLKFFNKHAKLKCSPVNTIATSTFEVQANDGYNPGSVSVSIIPRSPTEFIIRGLRPGQTQLIKLPMNGKVISAANVLEKSVISVCGDGDCRTNGKDEPLASWNLPLQLNAEEEAREVGRRQSDFAANLNQANEKARDALVLHLFSLSVLGDCCSNVKCREELLKRFKVGLVPSNDLKEPVPASR